MDAGWVDLLKIWGPLALGWPIAWALGRELLVFVREQRAQVQADVESRQRLAGALESLTKVVSRVADKQS